MNTRNYNLSYEDFDQIDNNWSAENNEKYGCDFNGCWYKIEDDNE